MFLIAVLIVSMEANIGVNPLFRAKTNHALPRLNFSDEFKDKVVLVTGGSSGIGYNAALQFARNGAHVVIASRDSNPSWFNGSTAANNINTDSQVIGAGGNARWVRTDVSNRSSVRALFQNIQRFEGRLDIAINNAGIVGPLGNINTIGDFLGTEHDCLLTNLYGVIHSLIEETQYFIDAQKNGIIVNVASIDGLIGVPGGSLYGASKFGISSLTRSVALEFLTTTPSIRVNAIAPGQVNTSLTWQLTKWYEDGEQVWEGDYVTTESALWKKWGPEILAALRSGRMAEPEEESAVILFLSSSAASYISGAVFPVDNGEIA